MWILKLKLNFQSFCGNVMGQINRGFFCSDSNLDIRMLAAFFVSQGIYISVFCTFVYFISTDNSWCYNMPFPFFFSSLYQSAGLLKDHIFVLCFRNGALQNSLLNMILSHLGRREMQQLRSWLVKLEWRSSFEFLTRYMT